MLLNKFIYTTLLLCFSSIQLFSQVQMDSIKNEIEKWKTSYKCTPLPLKVISGNSIRSLLRRDFSYLILNRDQSAGGAGAGITMDFNSDNTVVTYNVAFLNGSEKKKKEKLMEYPPARFIISSSVTAGFSNSIGNLFSNTKADPKAGITLKFSYLLSKASGPKMFPAHCALVVPVTQTYIEFLKVKGLQEYQTYLNLAQDIVAKQGLLAAEDAKLLAVPAPTGAALLAILKTKKELLESIATLQKPSMEPPLSALTVIQKAIDSLVAYELREIKWGKQTITWIDLQAGANVNAINLFDNVTSFSNLDTTITQKSFGIYINQLQNWRKALFYWRVGYKNSTATNIDNATSYILDESEIYNSGTNQRKIGKPINAYKMSETRAFEAYRKHVVEGESIFMFAKNRIGIHGFLDLNFTYGTVNNTTTGVLNGGLGIIFTAFNQAKDKVKFNIEPFFKLKDINAQTPLSAKFSTWERYTFGVKVGLPFNKVLL